MPDVSTFPDAIRPDEPAARTGLLPLIYDELPHSAARRLENAVSPADADWASSSLGASEMAARIRSFDWSLTPLGPLGQWPSSLREALATCLRSRFQMAIYWGPDLVFLYNDAEREILGTMHPGVLGRPAAELLAYSWDLLEPKLRAVLTRGEATWSVDESMRFNRRGFVEEAFFTYSYSPILDRGGIGGVLLVTFDTTVRVLADRRLCTLRELATETAKARSSHEVCVRVAEVLLGNPSDLPFSLVFLTGDDGEPRLSASTGVESAPDPDLWPLRQVVSTQQAVLIEDVASHLPGGKTALTRTALVLPIAPPGTGAAVGCFVAGLSDFQILDEDYRGFLELVAGQIATAIAAARALEEERRRAQAMAELDAAKTTFFSNVSHELRTPITLLLAPLEDVLAKAGAQLSPEDRERLSVAHRNAQRLLRLVNKLLEFSRIEAGRLQAAREPTDLAAFTIDLASMFRSTLEHVGIRLIVDCPPLARPAMVDRDMWEKIVLNLLSNAFKFTHAGEITVTLRQVGEDAALTVRDTGVGIPGDQLPRIFERFQQVRGVRGRSIEGTGIGLALVQELAKLHGGSVRAESTCGQGTTFVVLVPLGAPSPAHDEEVVTAVTRPDPSRVGRYLEEAVGWLPGPTRAEADPEARESTAHEHQQRRDLPQAGGRARVLVADDNQDMRQYLSRLLQQTYEVETVADGMVAMASARTRPPDLVLADVMMPELDGFGLLRELRADPRTSTVPVVLLSARAGEESRVEGLAEGADDYLVKPFSARELLARVQVHLEMARVRREAARRERELQAEAQEAREHAADILESITDGFIALDNEWRFTHVNAQAERINGMPREEHLGKSIWDVFPATRGTLLEAELRRAMVDREPVQFDSHYAPWDAWFHVKGYPSKGGGLSAFFHDITARKRSEEALRTAHDELERRVDARTLQLSQANARIAQQMAGRKRVERARTELLHRLVRAQEDEHRRVARELHDDLTQRLAVLAIDAGTLENRPGCPSDLQRSLVIMREQLASLSQSVHSLSRQLHPSILDDLGLVDALNSECVSLMQRDGIRVTCSTLDVPPDLSRDVALCIYRVAQEALRNVARHARSARAHVRLVANERGLMLSVRDWGVGFDFAARRKAGLGLESMRERARLIRARVAFRSRPGKGTKVLVWVPLKKGHE